ncbi:MAG TPA: hypothetical protein PLK35_00830 [Candidatus Moranbacteria bacterium]|nr:hypothetical protein [Candidatus Moranbacteria bacterium]
MKNKIIPAIFIIILAVLAYFGYSIFSQRLGNGQKVIKNNSGEEAQKNESGSNSGNSYGENSSPGSDKKSETLKITVTPSDCDKECSKFEKDEELEYCQEVCNIVEYEEEDENEEENDEENENCDDKNGLQKDYCLKDLAIDKEDFKICDTINDSGVKKTCQNRITEDLLDPEEED